MKAQVIEKLAGLPYPNITLDLWSDATMRGWLGTNVIGINNDWELLELTSSFLLVEERHYADAIKSKYDEVVSELKIEKKVHKIVADGGANVKCAFKSVLSADFETRNNKDINNTEEVEVVEEEIDNSEKSEMGKLELYDTDEDASDIDRTT